MKLDLKQNYCSPYKIMSGYCNIIDYICIFFLLEIIYVLLSRYYLWFSNQLILNQYVQHIDLLNWSTNCYVFSLEQNFQQIIHICNKLENVIWNLNYIPLQIGQLRSFNFDKSISTYLQINTNGRIDKG
jgi:hypothetical protein